MPALQPPSWRHHARVAQCLLPALALLAGLLAGQPAVFAQEPEPEREEAPAEGSVEAPDIGTFTLVFENDLLANTDDYYTNGIRIGWLPARTHGWARAVAGWIPLFPEDSQILVAYTLGQSMFTPEEITEFPPDPDDRPYAGWLYLGGAVIAKSPGQLDTLQLQLGVVGPWSLAEESQKFIHRIVGADRPVGWDFQLENEPGIVLTYERQWRETYDSGFGDVKFQVLPHLGASLGNVMTGLHGGGTVRFGQNIPDDYGPPRIRPAVPGSDFFVPADRFGWYIFTGVEGRFVARNIFLDGNTFRESRSVDKNVLVGDVQGGIAVTWGNARLAYTHVLRSKSFEGQDRPDSFGAISLSVRF